MTGASIYLIQNQQAAQRQLFEVATCEHAAQSTYRYVLVWVGVGGLQTWSQKAASVLTQTKCVSVFFRSSTSLRGFLRLRISALHLF